MKKIFLLALIYSSTLFASEQIEHRKITRINVYSTYAVVWLNTPANNADECTKENAGGFVAIKTDSPGGKEMFSTILAARSADRVVGFGVDGCLTWGGGTIPKAYRVDY